jgi:hypothetical protein
MKILFIYYPVIVCTGNTVTYDATKGAYQAA